MGRQPWFASIHREATQLADSIEGTPVARRLLAGTLSRQEYVDFLLQAYHCARWASATLWTAAHRLAERGRNPELARLLAGKRGARGGERWALSDLGVLGWPEGAVLGTPPSAAVARCVEWSRRSPEVAFLGASYVLSFLVGRYAVRAVRGLRGADGIRGIRRAVRFLRGQAATSAVEMRDLERALQWVTEPEDQRAALRAARTTRRLCSAIFRSPGPKQFEPPREDRRRLRVPPMRVLRALLERLLRGQAVEVVCRFSGEEVFRTRGTTPLLQRWFPGAAWRGGLPAELMDLVEQLERAPPGVREHRWVRKSGEAVLGVSFLRVSRCCAAVVKEVPLVPPPPASWAEVLTARELEVAARALQGMDYGSIAERLGVKPGTVTKHMQHVFDKLGVPTRSKLHSLADEARATAGATSEP